MWRNRSSSLLYSVSFASGKIKILCGKITIATPPLEITSTLQNTEGSIKKASIVDGSNQAYCASYEILVQKWEIIIPNWSMLIDLTIQSFTALNPPPKKKKKLSNIWSFPQNGRSNKVCNMQCMMKSSYIKKTFSGRVGT